MKNLIWKAVKAVRLQDISPQAQQNLRDSVVANYRNWKQQRMGYEEVWREIDRHVNQYDPFFTPQQKAELAYTVKINGGFGSKLKMVNVYSHREGIVAAMMKYLMSNDYDFFDIIPLDPLEAEKVQAVKEYFMWLFDVMDFESAYTPFVRDVAQYGTAIASYEWVREEVPRWKRIYEPDPVTGEMINIDYVAHEVTYDAPKFTPLNLYYAVIDPTAPNLDTATLIFKKPVTPHEILANQAYSNVDWEFANNAPEFGSNSDSTIESDREIARGNFSHSNTEAYKGKKEVYEAWGDFSDGEVLYKNYVMEIIGDRVVRFEPNPYMMPSKPFIIARYSTETNRIYGASPLASITGIQAGFDTIVNQYIDYWTMEINRPILAQANTIVRTAKEDKTKLPPISKDAVWNVRDVNGVKRLDWQGRATAMDPLPILQFLGQQMERATGDSELTSGGNANPYMKTGVAVTVADAGNAKFNMYAKNIEKESIVKVLEKTVDLLRQMPVDPKTFARKDIPGNQVVTFEPALLLNNMKFSMRGASYNATKQLQVNSLQQFLVALAQNQLTAPLVNWCRAIIIMGEALGLRNVRELLNPQAAQYLAQPNLQPTFMDRIKGFLGAGTPGGPEAPQETQPNAGQQFTAGLAPAFGGTNEQSASTSAFNPTGQN